MTSRLSVRRNLEAVFRSGRDWLAVLPALVAAGGVAATAFPPRDGLPAMAAAFEEWIFIAAIALVAPIALWRRRRALAAGTLACVVVAGCLFGSTWLSLPGGAARHDLTVMSWNVRAGARSPVEQVDQLKGTPADLVALQEVEPDAASAIDHDPDLAAIYPYRVMAPSVGTWGLAVLSRYPLSNVAYLDRPAVLSLTVATPRGGVHLLDVHGHPPDLYGSWPIPLAYDTSDRQADARQVRGLIDEARLAGDRLLVAGDFNTTPSEANYAVLTASLRDTHVEVGEGPGWTWRPSRLDFMPVAFLRIDLQLTAGAIRPSATSVDCEYRGDHCRLFGSYEID